MPAVSIPDNDADGYPFKLHKDDLDLSSILVDTDNNPLGVTSCSGIIAAPLHVLAQMPHLGFKYPPPGFQPRNPPIAGPFANGIVQKSRFVETVRAEELKPQGRAGLLTP